MRAGDLRTRALLQARVERDDEMGGKAVSYATLGALWCSVVTEGRDARELYEARKLNPKLTHLVQARYRPGVTPKMRLIVAQRVLDIVGVVDRDGRHAEMHLLCEEVVRA
jgi:SPP1 family predicted phage head-tail adaptor